VNNFTNLRLSVTKKKEGKEIFLFTVIVVTRSLSRKNVILSKVLTKQNKLIR